MWDEQPTKLDMLQVAVIGINLTIGIAALLCAVLVLIPNS